MITSESDRLNRWLTLGANLGVIVGLLILIVEVRQNADLTRAQMETGRNDLLAQIELSLATPEIGAAWVKSIRSPEALSDVEVRMVESHLVAVMLQLDHTNGLIVEQTLRATDASAVKARDCRHSWSIPRERNAVGSRVRRSLRA
jgi:hypothetical protein